MEKSDCYGFDFFGANHFLDAVDPEEDQAEALAAADDFADGVFGVEAG